MVARRLGEPFREPSGLLGRLGAWSMARWGAPRHRYALELLEAEPGQHIVEIGPAHGALIERLADEVPGVRVTGIEPSADMVRLAMRRNRGLAGEGRLAMLQARVSAIPLPNETADGAVSTDSLYFWPDLEQDFGELARILRPGGRLVLVFKATRTPEGAWAMAETGGTDRPSAYSIRRLRELLGLAGFEQTRARLRHLDNPGPWGKTTYGSVTGRRR